ncbi:MAG: acyl-CoA synthetase (AMP-forming)/AMP-acid ligase II [Parasphingorhabdus sp.]|jgi:acyl-CoA synthetase (AMP-forming)/AMP-acid ligase II
MQGLMMDRPLLIRNIIDHANRNFPTVEIVSQTVEGERHRYTYADAHRRSGQLSNALKRLGANRSDRIGTIAWNTYRHFELYFGTACAGLVCHTMNPRLFPEQLIYIVNHASDRWLFLDTTFVPLVEKLHSEFKCVEGYVLLCDREHMPETSLPNAMCYEELIAAEEGEADWQDFDENTASGLCYTSGTTGNPKGVLYSHRAVVLHSMAYGTPDAVMMSAREVAMPVVPMFHVNAWGTPFAAPMFGAKLVLPGPKMLDGATLQALVNEEGVTVSLGVPTIWQALMQHVKSGNGDLKPMNRTIIGGSACPPALMDAFEAYGVRVRHAWGMTESTPLGVLNTPRPEFDSMSAEQQRVMDYKTGHGFFGIEMKIVDDEDKELAWDGKQVGSLKIRGPWVCRDYYGMEGASDVHDSKGWFETGDVGSIDEFGFLQITDRTKDLIKSGGEWISSIDVENVAISFPGVTEAAAVAIEHIKWGERPLLVVTVAEGVQIDKQALLDYYQGKVATWWIPDAVEVIDEIPHTATGKISKLKLRQHYDDFSWPAESSD